MGGMMEIIITVAPHLEPWPAAGVHIHRTNYDARLGERLLCEAATTPFLTAARVLLAESADPDAVLAMRRPGTDHDALRARLGTAAGPDHRGATENFDAPPLTW
jgi:hypothetical protein